LLEALPSARREIGRWGQVRDVVVQFYLAGP
jgi:hypothetical protein